MRLVLDTNVAISALLWRGTPHRLLEMIRRQDSLQLCSSSALLEELTDVAGRPAFTRRLATIGKTAPEFLVDYLEAIEPVDVPRIARDPDEELRPRVRRIRTSLAVFGWRLGAESNRCTRLCRPLHDHSAT